MEAPTGTIPVNRDGEPEEASSRRARLGVLVGWKGDAVTAMRVIKWQG